MKTYKIMVEIELKEDCLYQDDFVYRAIEEQLETGEQIMDYELIEVTQ